MSDLKDKINAAIQAKKTIWIVIGDQSFSAGSNPNIVKGEGCEYLEVDYNTSTRLFNLSLINEIRISN